MLQLKRENLGGYLGIAVKEGHLDVVKELVGQGVDINADDYLGVAYSEGYFEIAKFLEKRGANTECNPIYYALKYNNLGEIKRLCDMGRTFCYDSLLRSVKICDEKQVLRILGSGDVDVSDSRCSELLHLTYEYRTPNIARSLLDHGADPNFLSGGDSSYYPGRKYETSFLTVVCNDAIYSGELVELALLLIKHGANVDPERNRYWKTSIECAEELADRGDSRLLTLLQEKSVLDAYQ